MVKAGISKSRRLSILLLLVTATISFAIGPSVRAQRHPSHPSSSSRQQQQQQQPSAVTTVMTASSSSSSSSCDRGGGTSSMPRDKLVRLFHIFGAKLVLEVFGGAGAIWGFSEAIGLRVPSTVWFWRPCALTFGAIFLVRWLGQVREHVVADDDSVRSIFLNEEKEAAADGDREEGRHLLALRTIGR